MDILVQAIEEMPFEKDETLLPLSSALETLAANAKDMTYMAVDRLNKKLGGSVHHLKELLSRASRADVLQLSHRLATFGMRLLEVRLIFFTANFNNAFFLLCLNFTSGNESSALESPAKP